MRKPNTLLLLCLLLLTQLSGWAQTRRSVLAEGEFYKLAVREKGLYKLERKFLASLGLDVGQLNPRHLRLYGNGGGMLPQANQAPRPEDLRENVILVVGEADGWFDDNDYVLFYAEGPDEQVYEEEHQIFRLHKNLYSEENYYFLQVAAEAGKRVGQSPSIFGVSGTVTHFDDFVHHERDQFNLLNSGRALYGETFGQQPSHTFRFPGAGLRPQSAVRVATAVVSQTGSPTHFDFTLNQRKLGTVAVRAVPNYAYGDKALEEEAVLSLDQAFSGDEEELALTIRLREGSNSLGYLNYFSLNFQRELRPYGKQTFFRSVASTRHLMTEFHLTDVSPDYTIWDVTDPQAVKQQAFLMRDAQNARFKTYTQELKEFVLFRGQDFPAPVFRGKTPNQNLHGLATPELLIISPATFWPAAQQLAQFRRQHDGLTVAVVSPEQIFNEFSSGKQDVTALRDFVRYLYGRPNQGEQLQYVLLLGDASYDYKTPTAAGNTNFVPIYQSRNSLHNVLSYASDDYLGFLEPHEGEWPESATTGQREHDLDVGVGRLPVQTPEEATAMVAKLIHYGTAPATLGDWRNRVAFVADDGDQNKHQHQSDFLAKHLEEQHPHLNPDRVFIDAYPQPPVGSGKSSPAVRQRLSDHLKKGVLILDYLGHGGETAWADEQILDLEMIRSWDNPDRLPLILSATCEFGRFDDTQRRSGAEEALLHPSGGAIALFTTTRPVFPNTVIYVNEAFYRAAFTRSEGQLPRLGDVYRLTKNGSVSGNTNRNFSFLGDPSMRLAYPRHEVAMTQVNEEPVSDQTQIRPLAKVTIQGEVREQGQLQDDFDGVVTVVVYDRPTSLTTLGDEAAPMTLQNRQEVIFQGRATVKKGAFSLSFVAPKDLNEQLAVGKISLYASHRTFYRDATGHLAGLKVGGEAVAGEADRTPPTIRLAMDHEGFQSGGHTSASPTLLVRLSDSSGINTNNSQGHGIRAILNNDQKNPIDLKAFYETDLDSYQHGRIRYPFHQLPPGRHDILLEASDTHNNRASAFIEFYVLEGEVLLVQELTVYPNPSVEQTTFRFRLGQARENVSVDLQVYSAEGRLVKHLYEPLPNSGEEGSLVWDRRDEQGSRVGAGLYFYTIRIQAESLPVFSNAPLRGKLILLR